MLRSYLGEAPSTPTDNNKQTSGRIGFLSEQGLSQSGTEGTSDAIVGPLLSLADLAKWSWLSLCSTIKYRLTLVKGALDQAYHAFSPRRRLK